MVGPFKSPGEWHFQGSPNQTAGSIACGYLDTLSQEVWTNDVNLMLGATECLDGIPPTFNGGSRRAYHGALAIDAGPRNTDIRKTG
jgi:hypothetical protein